MTPNLQKIVEKATDVLGDEAKALDWIEQTSATLGGSPKALSESDEGTNRVLIHLGTISRHSFT